jgi:ATP-dependent exoDNAse (exonuclease V) alpha subunit
MAIYSLNLGFISRSAGRSAVGFSAYISASQQLDRRTGVSYDYGCKNDVIVSRILAPEDAPEWAKNSSTLWNRAEQFEDDWGVLRFKNGEAREQFLSSAQTAQTIMGAIPLEFSQLEAEACVEEFLKERFVSRGLVVEYALHWEKGNPHFHGMITRRPLLNGEFSQRKDRDIVSKPELLVTRKQWEEVANKHLERGGHEVRIDSRSHADRESLLLPTAHEGWHAQRLAEGGQYSRIVADNEAIRQKNIEILCENPAILIQEVALKRTTFTRQHIEEEIIRRVGGDEKLFCLLKAKVEDIDIHSELVLKGANKNIVLEGRDLRDLAAKLTDRLLENQEITSEIGENLNRDRIFTSASYKKQEEHVMGLADALHKRSTKAVSEDIILRAIEAGEAELGSGFSTEQRVAITHLCSGSDMRLLNGKAGTGKTTLLKTVAAAYRDAGYQVLGTSFQGKAVEIMEQEIGIPCKTLDSFKVVWEKHQAQKDYVESGKLWGRPYIYAFSRMKELEQQRFTAKHVIIVDEANMIGGRLWEPFLKEATRSGAKVLIIQDPAQIKSREPGDYGRLFAERFGFCETNEVVRQRIPWQRECSKSLNDHQVLEGLKPYFEKGHLQWFEDSGRLHQTLAQAYVRDFIENPHQTRIALAYKNTEVYDLNQSIRQTLKEQGYLKGPFEIQGEEYAIGDLVRFTQNDNHGKYIQNADQPSLLKSLFHGEKEKRGVKNGSFGTIEFYDENKSRLSVCLDGGRRVQFNIQDYKHITHGYAMGIHKSEGSTFDKSFVSFDPLMDPATLLVAMTRHRGDVQAYINREQFVDFKDIVETLSPLSHKATLRDYAVSEEQKPYSSRIQQYRDLLIEGMTLREEMEGQIEAKTPLYKHPSYIAYQTCFEEKKRVAKEILADWQNHATYVRLAGIRRDVLEVEAGLRPRLLSDLEYRASIQVQGYMDLVKETRSLWKDISQTHPGALAKSHSLYEDYQALKTERDSIAAVFQENLKLYAPFFKVIKNENSAEENDYWGEKVDKENRVYISSIKSHARAHNNSQLQNLYYARLPEDQKAHYDVVKSYVTMRNEAAAIYSHLQKKAEESVQVTSPETFFTLEKFHALQAERDALALKVIDAPEKYQVFLETLKVKEDNLLHHAVSGEVREKVQAYANEADISKRASQAQELKRILTTSKDHSIFKEMTKDIEGIDFNRLTFDIAFYDKVKSGEISSDRNPEDIYKPIQSYLNASKEAARLWKMVQLKSQEEVSLKIDWQQALTARNKNAQLVVTDQLAVSVMGGMGEGIQTRLYQHAGFIETHFKDGLSLNGAPTQSRNQSRSLISTEQVLAAARGNYGSLATDLFGEPNKYMSTKSALRFGSKGSLLVNITGPKEGKWHDFESGERGNIFKLIEREKNLSFKEAVSYLADVLNVKTDSKVIPLKAFSQRPKEQDAIEEAKDIASRLNAVSELNLKSKGIEGTLVETYLQEERGIKGTLAPDLRYIPKGTTFVYKGERRTITHHCFAAFGCNHEGRLSSVQLTKLNDQGKRALTLDGQKLNKIQYGVSKGSFVVLQEGQNRVFMAEGLETALSIKEANVKGKIVASLGIHNMANYQGQEKEMILCADNDEHKPTSQTHKIIETTQNHFREQGKSASIIKPFHPGDDFNDIIKKQGAKGVQEYVKDYLNPDITITRELPKVESLHFSKTNQPTFTEKMASYLESVVKDIKTFEGTSLADKAKQELDFYIKVLEKDETRMMELRDLRPELTKEIESYIHSHGKGRERGR